MKILFLGQTFPASRAILRTFLPEDEIGDCPADRLLESVVGADVIVPAMCRVDAAIMDAGQPQLIHQFGVGLEGVDLAAANERGIPVANVPATGTGNSTSVAELAMLHMLLLSRRYHAARESVLTGVLGHPVSNSLVGKTVVIVGLGAIGCEVARRLEPFGVRLVGVGRRPLSDYPFEVQALPLAAYYPVGELRAALAEAQFVVLCPTLNPTTRDLIGEAELAAMPPGGYLINVARGPLIQYEPLLAALRSGHLAGAGLDVYWHEPIDPADPLLQENVTTTPHLGGVTIESYAGIAGQFAANIERLRRGEPLLNRAV